MFALFLETNEFLLYSSRHFIRRFVFGPNRDENIIDLDRIGMSGSIFAVAFDYKENMVYWFQSSTNKILVRLISLPYNIRE